MTNLDNGNRNQDNHNIVINSRHAVLFAEYGSESEYVQKIVSKLNERNIVVDHIFSPTVRKGISIAMQNADIILLMHEMSGHRDGLFIKETAKNLGKNVIFLPRKVSQWGNLTSPRIANDSGRIAPIRTISAVSDDNLEEFLRQYVELANKNFSHKEMLPKLTMFWEGPLGTPQQLGVMLHFLLRSDRCPEWFKAWWIQNRGTLPEVRKTTAVQDASQEAKEEATEEDEEKLLAEMYARDSERLSRSLSNTKEKVANLIYILLKEKGIPLTEVESMFSTVYKEEMNQNLLAFSMELAEKIVES